MAFAGAAKEQFECSICLDIFNDPVSTPCGHNFCKVCIDTHWDDSKEYRCPFCKTTFNSRPELRTNTMFRDFVDQFKSSLPKSIEVPCDVCSGKKLNAVKSCLDCVASYCEEHLLPHTRIASFKKHRLIDTVEDLEDRVCQTHGRPLELFCRNEQALACVLCRELEHKDHDCVAFDIESKEKKVDLGKMVSQLQQMIQRREEKVTAFKHSAECSDNKTRKMTEDSRQLYTGLMKQIEMSQTELLTVMEKDRKSTQGSAEGLVKELEQEISELQQKSIELEQLSHTEDHLHLLQRFKSLCILPSTKDCPEVKVDADSSDRAVRAALVQLRNTLTKALHETEIRMIQKYKVDVTFVDSRLKLSEGKNPAEPEKSNNGGHLGREGFSTGKFYFELQVPTDETGWGVGAVKESFDEDSDPTPNNGIWAIMSVLPNAFAVMITDIESSIMLPSQRSQKVGVFVDYQVSFYDVEKSHIYTFTGQTFTEKLYPFFISHDDDDDDDDDDDE